MATGYHIIKLKRFPKPKKFTTDDQLYLNVDGISDLEPVETTVTQTQEDFRPGVARYVVSHDFRATLKSPGRAKGFTFTEYITTQKFPIYVEEASSDESRCLIVATKAEVSKDFVTRLTKKRDDFLAIQRELDFAALRPALPVVTGAWFHEMTVANLSSSGMFGPHVDRSKEFKHAERHGKLKNLTTPYSYNGIECLIQIGIHGGVVLYDAFDEETALAVILDVKSRLLDPVWTM
jgi:hypothetical protein